VMRNLRCQAAIAAGQAAAGKAAGHRGCAIFIGKEESAPTRDIRAAKLARGLLG
jgi:hypothetical protein